MFWNGALVFLMMSAPQKLRCKKFYWSGSTLTRCTIRMDTLKHETGGSDESENGDTNDIFGCADHQSTRGLRCTWCGACERASTTGFSWMSCALRSKRWEFVHLKNHQVSLSALRSLMSDHAWRTLSKSKRRRGRFGRGMRAIISLHVLMRRYSMSRCIWYGVFWKPQPVVLMYIAKSRAKYSFLPQLWNFCTPSAHNLDLAHLNKKNNPQPASRLIFLIRSACVPRRKDLV